MSVLFVLLRIILLKHCRHCLSLWKEECQKGTLPAWYALEALPLAALWAM